METEWTGSVNERTGRIRMGQGEDERGASDSIPIPRSQFHSHSLNPFDMPCAVNEQDWNP